MDYITIGGKTVPYPNSFTMEQVPNIVARITTLAGSEIADINGWHYSETELQWDTLVDADLQNLLQGTANDTFTLRFTDLDGAVKSVTARKESRIYTKTRLKHGGKIVWKDIRIKLSFPDVYGRG